MRLEIDDKGSLEQAAEALRGLPGAIDKIAQKATRASMKGVKREATAKVAERYTIQRGRIGTTMRVAYKGKTAEFSSRGRVNDLAYFKHTPRSVPKHRPPKGKYLFSQVVKGEGGTIAHAFLARMRSGHVGVFERTDGNKSIPIEKKAGPSTPQMVGYPTIRDYLEEQMKRRFEEAMEAGTAEALGRFRT